MRLETNITKDVDDKQLGNLRKFPTTEVGCMVDDIPFQKLETLIARAQILLGASIRPRSVVSQLTLQCSSSLDFHDMNIAEKHKT